MSKVSLARLLLMSSDAVQEIIDVGHDLVAIKYFSVAAATVLFYDFLLTLSDEVEFAWRGKRSWVFGIFLANRYLPMGYQFWVLIMGSAGPAFSQRVYGPHLITPKPQSFTHAINRCDKTAFLSVFAFVGSTLLAQVVLTLRIYAVTGKNRLITSCLGAITISQFTLGLFLTALTIKAGAQQVLAIPLDPYRICTFVQHRLVEIGFTTISLAYDLVAFLLIAYVAVRSNAYRFQIPSLFRTIARDSALYFLVIFTSHLILELTLLFARPAIQLLPGTGNVVYLPVMITRLMLSLKKATNSREYVWSFGEPTVYTTVRFPDRRSLMTMRDEIPLDTFGSGDEGAQNQA